MTTPLTIDGEVSSPVQLTVEELRSWPDASQVRPVSKLIPEREGDAIKLSSLLEQVAPHEIATHITFHASADGFAASLPLELVRDIGLVIYQQNDQPLDTSQGGPFRFLIINAAPCKTDELDACANVKFVDRIELNIGPGKDTRNTKNPAKK